jgi:hypothetical protein
MHQRGQFNESHGQFSEASKHKSAAKQGIPLMYVGSSVKNSGPTDRKGIHKTVICCQKKRLFHL